MKSILFMAFLLCTLNSHARNQIVVAAIDSNFDLSHSAVEYRMFKNSQEIPFDGIDNDDNGFVDDSAGWDIMEDDAGITLPTPHELCNEKCRKYGELHFKRRIKQASAEELSWLSENKQLAGVFFNYLTRFHGLSIIEKMIRGTSHTYWVGLKLYEDSMLDREIPTRRYPETVDVEKIYRLAIDMMTKPFERAMKYLARSNVRIVNNSYYFSQEIAEDYLRRVYKDATGDEIAVELLTTLTKRGYREFFERASKMITENPDILFLAGTDNSGSDLDRNEYFPAHVKAENILVIQASDDFSPVDFTGYGKRSVDIAAPGVNQFYAIPGNMYAVASATSLAVPFVSNVAARMLEINPKLTSLELKTIIRKTAWFQPAFSELNSTSGVINTSACLEEAKRSVAPIK